MKYVRFFAAVLLILCMLLSVVACDEETDPASTDMGDTSSAPNDPSDSAGKPIGDVTGSTYPNPDTDNIQVSNPLGLKSLTLAAYLEKAMFDMGEPTPAEVTMAMLEGIESIKLSALESENTSTLSFRTCYYKKNAQGQEQLTDSNISCTLNYIPDLSGEKFAAFLEDLKVAKDLFSVTLSGLNIENINGISACPQIRWLTIEKCTGLNDLRDLSKLTSLTQLSLRNLTISDLSPIADLVNLEQLGVSFCPVTDISPLANLPHLESLNISSTDVTSLPVGGTTAVTTFSCGGIASHLTDITNIAGWLGENASIDFPLLEITDLSGIEKVGPLRTLNLAGSKVSTDSIRYLKDLTIREVLLDGTTITNVFGLAGNTGIEEIYLQGSTVADVSALATCTALKKINISGTAVTDISALAACTNLKTLKIAGLDVDTSAFDGSSVSVQQ